jgi:hypothetical protein
MRAGTVAAQVAAFQAACGGDVQPPKECKLTDDHLPIWRALVRARARDEWSEPDKFHCANLTRCLFDIERISAELVIEGDTLTNERGTRVVNPKHALLESLSRRAILLTKMMHLNTGAIVENVADLSHKRTQEKTARENAETTFMHAAGDDDFLARPPSHVQ